LQRQSSPDVLTASVSGLKPGDYVIRWQVLASDGHISRGEVPFKVIQPASGK
jgi:methionine-rich copper-binding protein CopC